MLERSTAGTVPLLVQGRRGRAYRGGPPGRPGRCRGSSGSDRGAPPPSARGARERARERAREQDSVRPVARDARWVLGLRGSSILQQQPPPKPGPGPGSRWGTRRGGRGRHRHRLDGRGRHGVGGRGRGLREGDGAGPGHRHRPRPRPRHRHLRGRGNRRGRGGPPGHRAPLAPVQRHGGRGAILGRSAGDAVAPGRGLWGGFAAGGGRHGKREGGIWERTGPVVGGDFRGSLSSLSSLTLSLSLSSLTLH